MKERLLNYFIDFFIIIAITALVAVLYSRVIKKDKITNLFGKAVLVVNTGSMEPYINAGDMIIISREHNYRVGDVITFDDDGDFVTHRIMRIDGDDIYTKGDANNISDEMINLNDVQGRVVYQSALWGFIILHLLKPFVIIYFAMIVLIYLYRYMMNDSKDKKEVIDEEKTKEEQVPDNK